MATTKSTSRMKQKHYDVELYRKFNQNLSFLKISFHFIPSGKDGITLEIYSSEAVHRVLLLIVYHMEIFLRHFDVCVSKQ